MSHPTSRHPSTRSRGFFPATGGLVRGLVAGAVWLGASLGEAAEPGSLAPAAVAARVRLVREGGDAADRLVALRELRDAQPAPDMVEPLLVELLQNRFARTASGREANELIRRTALEAMATQMKGRASSDALAVVGRIAMDPSETEEMSAQAAITIACLNPEGETGEVIARMLIAALRRPALPPMPRREITITVGEIGYEARAALGDLLSTLEGRNPDPSRYEPAAEAFEAIAKSLKGRCAGLGAWELLRLDYYLDCGKLALQRAGSEAAKDRAGVVSEALEELRAAEGRKPVPAVVRYIDRQGSFALFDLSAGAGCWLLVLTGLLLVRPTALPVLDGKLRQLDFRKMPWIGPLLQALWPTENIGRLVSKILLVDFFARLARARIRRRADATPRLPVPPAPVI